MSVPSRRSQYRTKMNELDDIIGKWSRLQQAGKESVTLSVRIGHGGPGQHNQQQKFEVPKMVQHSKDSVRNERVNEPTRHGAVILKT